MEQHNKIRVVHLLNEMNIGGVDVAALRSFEEMSEKFDFYLVCVGQVKPELLMTVPERLRSRIVGPTIEKGLLISRCLTAAKEVRRLKPEVLISSLWKAGVAAIWLNITGLKTHWIHFLHSSRFFHLPDAIVSKIAVRMADAVIVDSQATKEFVKSFAPKAETEIVSYVPKLAPQLPPTMERFQEETKKFVFLGRISEVKRLDRSIEIIAALKKKGLKVQYDIFGPEIMPAQPLKDLAKRLDVADEVRFRGSVLPSEVPATLSKYAYYLQTSDWEGMAVSVIEAMNAGLVCFVTPVGDIPKYAEDGKTALFINTPEARSTNDNVNDFKNIASVFVNVKLLLDIAINAQSNFRTKQNYGESLERQILKINFNIL